MSSVNPTMLIIDDDQLFRSRLARAFRDRNFVVDEAWDLSSAKSVIKSLSFSEDIAEHNRPLWVVLDLKVGNESGLDILIAIKLLRDNLRVVVLTGYGSISTAVEAIRLGAYHYLTKPTHADAILAAFGDGPEQSGSETLSPYSSQAKREIPTPELSQVEWDHIQRVLHDCGGNLTRAAQSLGLHRRSLQRKLAKNPARLR